MVENFGSKSKRNKLMKILFVMSSYNIYGGTPKKTLDLVKHFQKDAVIYVYNDKYSEFKILFENTGCKVYEGFYGKNVYLHVKKLYKLIKNEKINIVQAQFAMGEILGFIVKILKPKIKLIIAFVGTLEPNYMQRFLLKKIYKKTNHFVYVSNYVKVEKEKQFPILKSKSTSILYNGTEVRQENGEDVIKIKSFSILDVAGLIELKNIQILIEAFRILVYDNKIKDIFLYIAGDGPQKNELNLLIKNYKLEKHIFLLGYQKNVGRLINECDIFAHPCYQEGFGIAVAEAMLGEKPIIVANAGALPELIENEVSGLVVDPHDAEQWADAILKIIENPKLAEKLARNGKERAHKEFSKERYTLNYENLYKELIIK